MLLLDINDYSYIIHMHWYVHSCILIIATNEVWSLSSETLHKCSTHFESFGQLALYLRAKLSIVEFEEFAILCNMVWQ